MSNADLRAPLTRTFITMLMLLASCLGNPALAAKPLPVKVVVLSMFENGEPTGDKPGELQLWLERNPGLREMPFALGEYSLYYGDNGLLVACLGGGIPNATASTMALGLDERFDLTKAYWLIAGIAGGDP
ncbi:MAG: purine nucleoside permease, partial [Congregibacter sp.]|nr:purine nucleoside permease [Congregibacter sp.]